LHITSKGRTFIKEKLSLPMRHYVKSSNSERDSITGSRKTKKSSALATLTTEADQTLYTNLRVARGVLAKSQNVAAYVIFHDKTLIELAKNKPSTLEAMLDINGIGETKLKRYGQPLLDVINQSENAA
jgi:ATP-dependent DNA helicase RecQ